MLPCHTNADQVWPSPRLGKCVPRWDVRQWPRVGDTHDSHVDVAPAELGVSVKVALMPAKNKKVERDVVE